MKTLLLIDANSLIHRTFHALPPLSGPGGIPTQSLYGLSSVLLKLFKEDKPDFAAAAFDRPEKTFRKEKYEAYKAQRPASATELISQIIEAPNVFKAFGIKCFEKAGFEADDIIATIAEKFRSEKNLKIIILTGDLDTLQLVENDHVVVRTFRKGISDTFIYNEEEVKNRYGLNPNQLVDYKALVGDPSDNIKGVTGVGPKTAATLLQRHGTLDAVFKNLATEQKIKDKFETGRDQIMLSRELVTLRRDVPIEVESLSELEISALNREELRAYFLQMGFETLLRRLEESGRPGRRQIAAAGVSRPVPQLGLFESPTGFFGPIDRKIAAGVLFITEGLSAPQLKKIAATPGVKSGFGLKELEKTLLSENLRLKAPFVDLGVAYWLIDPDFKAYEPDAIAKIFLKKDWDGSKELYEEFYAFAMSKLKAYEMEELLRETEMPLLEILAEIENYGIGVSRAKLEKLEREISLELELLTKKIYSLTGTEFNLNSPKQLAEVLYGNLKLKPKASSKLSTSADRLELLKNDHPVVNEILKYREDFKILSTYVRPLISQADENGRVRTQFIQTGTGTGRLSSKNPNLQNIPQESHWSQKLRAAFEPAKNFTFFAADYSQLELRIMAALSQDVNMLRTFTEGRDIHRTTAAKILGKEESAVTKQERRLAKTLNFGLMYGMGSTAFATAAGVGRGEAKEFISAYFKNFSGVRTWRGRTIRELMKTGFVKTLTNRRRYFPQITSGSPRFVSEAERAGLNHPIQGLEADIIKKAMINCRVRLAREKIWGDGVRLLLTIHDELLFEIRNDIIGMAAAVIRAEMENAFKLSGVNLEVETYTGADWGHMEPFSA